MISIHALRVEGDTSRTISSRRPPRFLSTPSGWRATLLLICAATRSHISIHAHRVEGDAPFGNISAAAQISIHALRVEGDCAPLPLSSPRRSISIHALRVEGDLRRSPQSRYTCRGFLSTPSGWRATEIDYVLNCMQRISILALRVEGDRAGSLYHAARRVDFYPRPPGGGRLR